MLEAKSIGIPSSWFSIKTSAGRKEIEKTREKVSLSIESISFLFGKNPSVKKYPGRVIVKNKAISPRINSIGAI